MEATSAVNTRKKRNATVVGRGPTATGTSDVRKTKAAAQAEEEEKGTEDEGEEDSEDRNEVEGDEVDSHRAKIRELQQQQKEFMR